jgi:hypothetical protein
MILIKICVPIIIGIVFLIFIIHSIQNADDAIEDENGDIISYRRHKNDD